MGNAPEVVREVGVNDFRVAPKQLRFHLDHRLLGVSPGAVGVLLWWKIGFKYRRTSLVGLLKRATTLPK